MPSLFDLEMGTETYDEAPAVETVTLSGENEISLWDRFKESIVPESYGESIVNSIYSTPSNTLKVDPAYDKEDLSSPNVYVQAKGAVKDFASAAAGFGGKLAIIVIVVALLAIFVHGFAGSLLRK